MRITGGEFRGRNLVAPSGQSVRPTSDRVRQAIFNILIHGDVALEDARVIDLFAGSGAMGLEALSHGSAYALFVEDSASSRAAIRRNIETLGLTGRTRIFRRDATRLGPIPAGLKPFNLAILDPPYGKDLITPALSSLTEGGWLEEDARLVIETRTGEDIELPEGFTLLDERTYSDTSVRFVSYR